MLDGGAEMQNIILLTSQGKEKREGRD